MLSFRSTLTVCLLLLAAPIAQAEATDVMEALFEPSHASGEPPVSAEDLPRDELRQASQTVQTTAHETAEEAEAVTNEAIALLQAKLAELQGVADDVVSTVEETREDAERRIPAVEEDAAADSSAEEGGYDLEPTASMVAPVDLESIAIVGATAAVAGILFWLAGSTGQIGSQAVATTAELRRVMPYASPMFTRFERDTVLGHPKREALYANIISKPGVTLQDLCDATGLSRTAVSHHLRLLDQQHLVVSKRVGRSRHFFENGGRYGRDQKDAYAVLHNDRSKDVHNFIQGHPGAIQKDLCAALSIQASVAHWHVKRLEEAQLIEAMRHGRTVSYFPRVA